MFITGSHVLCFVPLMWDLVKQLSVLTFNGLNNFVEDDKLPILPCQGPARAEQCQVPVLPGKMIRG